MSRRSLPAWSSDVGAVAPLDAELALGDPQRRTRLMCFFLTWNSHAATSCRLGWMIQQLYSLGDGCLVEAPPLHHYRRRARGARLHDDVLGGWGQR